MSSKTTKSIIEKKKKKKAKNPPSLAHRMLNKYKYKKPGNNPLFSYPSIPPPIHYDPKYSRNSPNKITKFATLLYGHNYIHNLL